MVAVQCVHLVRKIWYVVGAPAKAALEHREGIRSLTCILAGSIGHELVVLCAKVLAAREDVDADVPTALETACSIV